MVPSQDHEGAEISSRVSLSWLALLLTLKYVVTTLSRDFAKYKSDPVNDNHPCHLDPSTLFNI